MIELENFSGFTAPLTIAWAPTFQRSLLIQRWEFADLEEAEAAFLTLQSMSSDGKESLALISMSPGGMDGKSKPVITAVWRDLKGAIAAQIQRQKYETELKPFIDSIARLMTAQTAQVKSESV
jgi:hypothetical protein